MRESSQACGSDNENVLKGVTAGLIGGLVASWVMEEFQSAWLKLSESLEEARKKILRAGLVKNLSRPRTLNETALQ